MIDRLKLIPFTARFEPTPQNNKFVQELEADHLDEVFSWIVEGARQFYADGIGAIPECCTVQMQQYIDSNDNVASFMSACLEAAPGLKMERGTVRTMYENWCEQHQEEPVTRAVFYKQVGETYTPKKTQGRRLFVGLRKVFPHETKDDCP